MRIGSALREKEWTLLFYHAGDTNMGQTATAHLLNLENVGSDDNVDIVCLHDKRPWLHEKFGRPEAAPTTYHVTRNPHGQPKWIPSAFRSGIQFMTANSTKVQSPVVERHSAEFDSGNPASLKRFVLDSMKRFPAKHYALIMTGHGGGLVGQAVIGRPGAQPDSRISNDALGQVLEEVAHERGQKLEVLNLDTCYGASVEVVHPLRRGVDQVVGSQGAICTATQPVEEVVKSLQDALRGGRTVSPRELAASFVTASRNQPLSNFHTPTLSAIDTAPLQSLGEAVGHLHQTIVETKTDPNLICQALEASQKFDYGEVPRRTHLYDLGSLAQQLTSLDTAPAVKEAAQRVAHLVAASVVAETHQEKSRESLSLRALRAFPGMPSYQNFDGALGLSVFYDTDVHSEGSKVKFLRGSGWEKASGAESFFQYLSQVADSKRLQRSGPALVWDKLTSDYRNWERKLERSIGVPFVVPAAKLALAATALGLAAAGLPHLVPLSR